MIESIRLPELEENVSRIALGGCPLGGHGWGAVDDTRSVAAVRAAVDAGVTFFDTADVYGLGHSEALLSQALAEDRHRVTVATKFGVRMGADGRLSGMSVRLGRDQLLRRVSAGCGLIESPSITCTGRMA